MWRVKIDGKIWPDDYMSKKNLFLRTRTIEKLSKNESTQSNDTYNSNPPSTTYDQSDRLKEIYHKNRRTMDQQQATIEMRAKYQQEINEQLRYMD